MITARAPAKLIISGEHSVLYGQPAIALAVNRYTSTTVKWSDNKDIHFKLIDLSYAKSCTLNALRSLKQKLQNDYQSFLDGQQNIKQVVTKPFELIQFAVSNLVEYFNLSLNRGVEIAIDSNIPIGCGMGSSAAAIISTMQAFTNIMDLDLPRTQALNFARNIENLQHGRSSGLDLHLVTYGGCVRFENTQVDSRPIPKFELYMVNTGKAESSTGECVIQAEKIFKQDQGLANNFGATTNAIDQALINNDFNQFKQSIRENHKLLNQLGVVPAKVAKFVADIEINGGAAKICVAGSVSGDNAGIVLLCGENIQQIVKQYGYQLQKIEVDTCGATVV